MSSHGLTLLVAKDGHWKNVRQELAACGIRLETVGTGAVSPESAGFLVTKPEEMDEWAATSFQAMPARRLLLVYGTRFPCGWTEELANTYGVDSTWEVVRMALVSGGERALIGGDPNSQWIRSLCRLLAKREIVSLVCGRREVDVAITQLPHYLAVKERFYLELGDVCDVHGVSLQQVARALGMDKRIGQEWLFPERDDPTMVCQWIERECSHVMRKTNVRRVALWGPVSFWKHMPAGWLAGKEVRLYSGADEPFPNEPFPQWLLCATWTKALEQADLLVIGQADRVVGEISLPKLVSGMQQTIVVDAASCFPLQEAQAYLISYRAIGEKTNVWE